MKKILILVGLLMIGISFFAQEERWIVSILPGYQINTSSYQYTTGNYRGSSDHIGKTRQTFTGSVDISFEINKHYGLHFAYFRNDGKVHEGVFYDDWVGGASHYYYDYRIPVSIWEIGPEFVIKLSDNVNFYTQINVGHTFSSGNASYNSFGYYFSKPVRDNEWAFGASTGFRYFFLKNTGMAIQGGYHHINGWRTPNIWDIRMGITFRF